jgi:hypothetical protein
MAGSNGWRRFVAAVSVPDSLARGVLGRYLSACPRCSVIAMDTGALLALLIGVGVTVAAMVFPSKYPAAPKLLIDVAWWGGLAVAFGGSSRGKCLWRGSGRELLAPRLWVVDKGRVPTARRKAAEVIRLKDEGLGATEIARSLSMGRASVYRVLNGASGQPKA